jgi:outer membrane protein, protease secretion system
MMANTRRTARMNAAGMALAVGAAATLPAHGVTLAEAYRAAVGYDAQYQAAKHELEALRYEVPIARASLMPGVALNASANKVMGQREFANSQSQEVQIPLDYVSPQVSLSMRAPLFNYDSVTRVRQASAAVEAAQETLRARHTDLVNRLVTVYLQLAGAVDSLRLANWEIEALQGQLTRSRQRQLRGEGTLTEVARTDATLELARAKALEAQDLVGVGARALKRITGLDAVRVYKPAANFKVPTLLPERLQEWMDLAMRQNPLIISRQYSVEAARHGIERSRAGHLPRVDVVASIAQQRNESPTNVGQTSLLKSVGVQLSVPLYNGGGVDASVRQSIAERDRAEENVRVDRESVLLDVERYYRAVVSAPGKLAAFERAVQSSETELRGAMRAQEVGMGTVADVLDARTRLNTAQRDLGQARLDYLESYLRLLTSAGVPLDQALEQVGQVLTTETLVQDKATK